MDGAVGYLRSLTQPDRTGRTDRYGSNGPVNDLEIKGRIIRKIAMPKLSAYLAQAEAVGNERISQQGSGSIAADFVTGRFQALHAKRLE